MQYSEYGEIHSEYCIKLTRPFEKANIYIANNGDKLLLYWRNKVTLDRTLYTDLAVFGRRGWDSLLPDTQNEVYIIARLIKYFKK